MERDDPISPELAAASALLFLSDEEHHHHHHHHHHQIVLYPAKSHPLKKFDLLEETIVDVGRKNKEVAEDEGEKTVQSDSTSRPSSIIIISEGSSDAVQSHRLHVMAAAARCQELKLKVVRRTRSKVHYITGSRRSSPKARKIIPTTISSASAPKMMTSRSATTSSQGSCLSSGGSSEISSARSSQYDVKKRNVPAAVDREEVKKRGVRSTHIHRRAEAILKLLSDGCSSEVRIRQLLGDSPDTSKALRMLVNMGEVKRSGAGGRFNPYIYTIAEESSTIAS